VLACRATLAKQRGAAAPARWGVYVAPGLAFRKGLVVCRLVPQIGARLTRRRATRRCAPPWGCCSVPGANRPGGHGLQGAPIAAPPHAPSERVGRALLQRNHCGPRPERQQRVAHRYRTDHAIISDEYAQRIVRKVLCQISISHRLDPSAAQATGNRDGRPLKLGGGGGRPGRPLGRRAWGRSAKRAATGTTGTSTSTRTGERARTGLESG
jgi:hypothetical protein